MNRQAHAGCVQYEASHFSVNQIALFLSKQVLHDRGDVLLNTSRTKRKFTKSCMPKIKKLKRQKLIGKAFFLALQEERLTVTKTQWSWEPEITVISKLSISLGISRLDSET